MGSEWLSTTLGEISTDVSYGYTESASTERIGPHFLRITDIQNGVVDWNSVPYCLINDSKLKKYLLHRGDIVIARTGNSTGENYIFTGCDDTVFASYLIRFQVDRSKADPFYVWYNMRSPTWWNFVNLSKTGSAQAGANAKLLGLFPLKLPPVKQQRAIAHILGSLDDKIELNRQINATLESMAQALFKSWFVDFDPVIDNILAAGNPIPEPLQARAEARASLGDQRRPLPETIRQQFPNSFVFTEEMGWVPEGWAVLPLASITTELRRGISPNYIEEGGVCVVNQKCIRDHVVNFALARRNDETKRKVDGRELIVGDLLVNSTGVGTLGRMAQVLDLEETTVVDSHVTVIRSNAEIYKLYTFARMMLHLEPIVEAMGEGSTGQTELSRALLQGMSVLVPSLGCQKWAESVFFDIAQKVVANTAENELLSKLRNTLLPKLLSGQLRIPDAETIVKAV